MSLPSLLLSRVGWRFIPDPLWELRALQRLHSWNFRSVGERDRENEGREEWERNLERLDPHNISDGSRIDNSS